MLGENPRDAGIAAVKTLADSVPLMKVCGLAKQWDSAVYARTPPRLVAGIHSAVIQTERVNLLLAYLLP
jgi:hypothetical protein